MYILWQDDKVLVIVYLYTNIIDIG